MTEQYLILHKVRGEPAFDIAEKVDTELGEIWIVSTSGHVAYPWFTHPLDLIVQDITMNVEELPVDLPDHYSTNDRKKKEPSTTSWLAEKLGLIPKLRRI